ncbi:G-protein coupled receptor Mth2-like [Arctopsyche grandis]|uniref:G-protein coupled receptor Mth2-like n=1 Tax=Arctopsyche grandis TaxID=121162 RepID=UPI00406D6EB8
MSILIYEYNRFLAEQKKGHSGFIRDVLLETDAAYTMDRKTCEHLHSQRASKFGESERLVVTGTLDRRRARGRSPKRWSDQINELSGSSLNTAFNLAQNREEWRRIVNQNQDDTNDHESLFIISFGLITSYLSSSTGQLASEICTTLLPEDFNSLYFITKMLCYFLSFITIAAAVTVSSSENPCNYHTSVNISHGLTMANGSTVADGVIYSPDQQFVHEDNDGKSHLRGCLCMVKPCIRKCCGLGEAFEEGSCNKTEDPMANYFNPPIYNNTDLLMANDSFGLVFSSTCDSGQTIILNPFLNREDEFFLQLDSNASIILSHEMSNFSVMDYCIEAWTTEPSQSNSSNWTTQYLPMVCLPPEEEEENIEEPFYFLLSVGMIISIPFLIATLSVYAMIPKLQNLHGKSLMGYVSGLLVGYTFMSIIRIHGSNMESTIALCISMAFIVYMSLMASFFWLNVMCFDIWWTFRNLGARQGTRHITERRRFLIYSLYAWGSPLILTTICAIMQFHPDIPQHHVLPQIGNSNCWFHDDRAELRYFHIPSMIIIGSNLIMFVMTAFKILSIKRETAMLRSGDNSRNCRFDKNKQRFILYFKLFLITRTVLSNLLIRNFCSKINR